ncbi:MAG: response regulator, partial [Flavobacteriaceae bacterium]|nr:response regulator [Flavobacteriaceae bacterium]
MNKLSRTLFSLILHAVVGISLGQQEIADYTFEEITIPSDDGLQAWSNIEQFYEDEDGIIWAIIDNGLYRYNGHTAVNVINYLSSFHNKEIGTQPGTKFLIDSGQKIWYGQRKGLYWIDPKRLSVEEIYLDEPLHSSNWRNYILELEEHNDTIYVGTANGLYLLERNTKKVLTKYLNDGKDVKHRESSNSVQSIYPTIEKDAIWVVLMNGLYRINKADGSTEKYTIEDLWPDPYAHNFNTGHLYEKVLFFPSWGLGIVEFDMESKKFSYNESLPKYRGKWEYNIIRSAIPISDSTLLVNVTRLGNALFNRYTKKYQWLPTPNAMNDGVFLNTDRSGYIWGSKRGRIFRSNKPLAPDKLTFQHTMDISSFSANGMLKNRPSIDGLSAIQLGENERNIHLEFSITKAHILSEYRYEYQLNESPWKPISTPNELKLFDLESGNHNLAIRTVTPTNQVLSKENIAFQIYLPFYKSTYFIALCILLTLGIIYFLITYYNQKKLSRKLLELDALKSNFFANISHEFRTPLTLISSPIDKILSEDGLDTTQRKHLKMASRNSKNLLALVDQLLDLSKIDSGSLSLELEHGQPGQLVASWSESFSYLASQKNIKFQVDIQDKNNSSWFDRDALKKITTNLLSNAIKYTPKNGKVSLKTSIQNGNLFLSVENDGKGLSKAQKEKIFERFYQADDFQDGVGIGLSLVKELVSLHKGSIHVESEPDKWTRFEVKLCVDKNSFPKSAINNNSEVALATKWPVAIGEPAIASVNGNQEIPIILIVEDNPDVQTLLAESFKMSYQVLLSKNGEEGITTALEHIPDLIISDVMMPVKDGIELTRTLKLDERTSHIPIVLLTAKAGDMNELTGIEVGADDYITKPFNQKILKSKVKGLIELRKKLQSRYSQEVILKPRDIAITSVDEQFLQRVQSVLDEKLAESSFTVAAFSKAVNM